MHGHNITKNLGSNINLNSFNIRENSFTSLCNAGTIEERNHASSNPNAIDRNLNFKNSFHEWSPNHLAAYRETDPNLRDSQRLPTF